MQTRGITLFTDQSDGGALRDHIIELDHQFGILRVNRIKSVGMIQYERVGVTV